MLVSGLGVYDIHNLEWKLNVPHVFWSYNGDQDSWITIKEI
jgi:hypothetical protein